MVRKSKQDWLETAFNALSENGGDSPTIDQLTKRLGVTKGSFYHHFGSYQDFKEQLLDYWEETLTQGVVALTEGTDDPREIFSRFIAALAQTDPGSEIAIRAWAIRDEDVRARVERVDAGRVEIVRRWLGDVSASDDQAYAFSRLMNTLLVGCYSVIPPIVGEDLVAFMQEFFALTGIGGMGS
ncbi:MAG: TetR/AcrR family transcriptional regulator [Anaerolineae bacterium]|nr:TetR/AcrR family transcriptional regulator [Anaerolineae bacterium]